MGDSTVRDPLDEPILLTPGPLTTSRNVKEAMLRDWGARDSEFMEMNRRVRDRLVDIAGGAGSYEAILIQGSGTFANEGAIGTFVPRDGKLLVLINGAYGRRIRQIAEMIGRAHSVLEWPEDATVDPAAVSKALAADPGITHVSVVYCETTSGVLNPLAGVAEVVAAAGRRLLIDAMSAFGALSCDAREIRYDALVSSFNKCLEGVPGVAFAICRREALEEATRQRSVHSHVLDLIDQWRYMEQTGQWRFTAPTHVIAAFDRALSEHAAEGGVESRGARYRRNCQVLVDGMRALGFRTLLPDEVQAPIIVTFHTPSDPRWSFEVFYDGLRRRGYVIYPGKLTKADTFRIGCIGRISEGDIRGALTAIRETLGEMDVRLAVSSATTHRA